MSTFKPFVSGSKNIAEFTLKASLIGLALGFIFGLGITYLALKVGMTISASIPASIMSMAILKLFKKSTILENNIAQTIASAGEGLAGGVAFTMPALLFAAPQTSAFSIFILALVGGLLGVFFMIPLRRVVIVEEHGKLPFPEGTACAEILKIGQKSPEHGLPAFIGVVVGGVYKGLMSLVHAWPETARFSFPGWKKLVFSMDATPALLGVGYLVGARLSLTLLAGSIFSWWVLIPMIDFFASSSDVIFPATISIGRMSAEQVWSNYIRYIGAGAIALGGMLSLIPIIPMLVRSLKGIDFKVDKDSGKVSRLERSLSLKYVPIWIVVLALALWLFPFIQMDLLTTVLVLIFGFFFVAVTSFTVGIVGVSSNPISGMIITALLCTCGIFLGLEWTDQVYLVSAITLGGVVSISCAIAADTSQDLKTGFLVGATPLKQQLGMILGVAAISTIMGVTIKLFNSVYELGSMSMPAPQATLIYMLAKGMLGGNLPLSLIVFGVMIAIAIRLLGVSVMAFAIGMYLPLSLVIAISVGGILSLIVEKFFVVSEHLKIRGILLASGIIGADALMGVVIALLTVVGFYNPSASAYLPHIVAVLAYLLLAGFFLYYVVREEKLLPKSKR